MIFTELITQVLRELSSLKNLPGELWQEGFLLHSAIGPLNSGDDAFERLGQFCVRAAEIFDSEHSKSSKQIVNKVKKYVEEHYDDSELSLTAAGEHAAVSTGYLSALFKKETGLNFVKYLTETRMRAAAELLLSTDKRTYEIAYQTGFANPHYFSVAFKKHTGFSPSEFRAQRRRQGVSE